MNQSGFVNIIKPTGMTSSDVVLKVKRILGTKKVGHLGTLDPAASGVLPIAVGRATKFFDYFLSKDKVYVASVIFGIETDILDSFGKVLNTKNSEVSLAQINSVLYKFIGEIEQIPPKFSAIKINGKRAYDLARESANFEIKPRKINIYSIKAQSLPNKNEFLFKVHCSAGTYIRTLMTDIAHEINGICTVPVIIREKSGLFDINSAITLDELEETKNVQTIQEVFSQTKIFDVNEKVCHKLFNGIKTPLTEIGVDIEENLYFFAKYNNDLIGFYLAENGFAKQIVYLYNS